MLQAEQTESKWKSQVPKTSKSRSKLSSGKMEAERKRHGKKFSSVAQPARRPAPVQKTVLSSQSCPGLRVQPCFQGEQPPPAVDTVTGSEVKQPRLNPVAQTEHVQHLGCSASGERNGLLSAGLQTSTAFNCRLTTSTPALSPQTSASVPSQAPRAGSDGETQLVGQHWAIIGGPPSPHRDVKTAVPASQDTASLSVAPAVQQLAFVPADLPPAAPVLSAPRVGSAGHIHPLLPQCGAVRCPPAAATPAARQVHPHPLLVRASSQEERLSCGESSEESRGCSSEEEEEEELEGVDVMPVRDTSGQTSMDRRTVMLNHKNKSPSPEKTGRKVMTVKYLLGELKTLVANQDSEAVRLISEVEECVSLLPAMVGSTNVQAELALALQPLRSENVQLRRRLRILNQQLLERERAERQARPVDCDLELVSLQSLNFTLQAQLKASHGEVSVLQQENQRLRQTLEEKEKDLQCSRQQSLLDASRIRTDVSEALDEMRNCQTKLESLERDNHVLTHSLQQRGAEITRLQEIIRHLQKSPTRDTACHFTQTDESKPSSQLTRSVLDLHESQQEEDTIADRVPDSVKIYFQTLKGMGCVPDCPRLHPKQLSPPSSNQWTVGEERRRLHEVQASSSKGLLAHRSAQPSAPSSWTQEEGTNGRTFVPLRETGRTQTNTHAGLTVLGLAFKKLGSSNELPNQDLDVLDKEGCPSRSDRVGLQVTRTNENAGNLSEQTQPARRRLWMGDDASVNTGRPSVLESTLSSCDLKSFASDSSVNSWSTFNTCKEKDFQNGLAALDASIANLQRTLKADLKL
ncbi:coiled-coil domain-containing protein 14 isoform X2 [Brachyhypopomus gauderio]